MFVQLSLKLSYILFTHLPPAYVWATRPQILGSFHLGPGISLISKILSRCATVYSRTTIARTLMARLQWLFRTRS